MRVVQDKDGQTTIYIESAEERDAFMTATDEQTIWEDENVPILKRDVERVIMPRELYPKERPDLLADQLISELYKELPKEPKTKLDVVIDSIRERAGDGGISSASYNRPLGELHVEYVNGTVETIQVNPPERQLQDMAQGREPVAARAAAQVEQPERLENLELPDAFTVEVMIDRPSPLEGDWISVRRTDTYSRTATGAWAVSSGVERDSAQELITLEQQLRHALIEAERLERKRREEQEREQADVNRGKEDDGYIPGVYEPEYGH